MNSTTESKQSKSVLERRLELTVSLSDIEQEAQKRLARISKTVKMPGFRPGKVPMKVVAQTYGAQAHSEAMGDVVSRVYSSAVMEQKLRVAGPPQIEPVSREGASETSLFFEAVVEVYPDFSVPSLSGVKIKKIACPITEEDVDRTLETLRQQRATFTTVDRPSEKGDRINLDFKGEIDGVAFTGGTSENYSFVLGDGSMLKEFDQASVGMRAGETKTFPLKFPEDYHGKDVAGKLAMFTIKIRTVAEPKVPELDDAFAKSMGVEGGDLQKLREDVRRNLEREVTNRCKSKTKTAVMDALLELVDFEVPGALIKTESERLAESTRNNLAAQGMNVKDAPIPAELFAEQARRRVRLGLLVGEIVKTNSLAATEPQVRSLVEEMAGAYEDPKAFVNWYLGQPKQRAEAEAVVIEDNVVAWALAQADVSEEAVSVKDLMTESAAKA